MATNESKSAGAHLFFSLGSVLMILGLLYFGKPVLVPVALSVLLAFILSPLVEVLNKGGLGRLPSVLLASGLTFAIIGASSWGLFSQLKRLAIDLPNHKQEIQTKLVALRVSDDSTMGRLTDMFNEIFPPEGSLPQQGEESIARNDDASTQPPIVVAREAKPQFSSAMEILLPVIEPVATSALVIVLVMFLLLRREDVRYRVISLMGDAALTGTTRLMRDTAERVSKYLLNLLIVNAAFGLWFGVGLYLLGVPYAPLWGFLTLGFRFIPFLGSPASVLFPLLISIATSVGWTQPIGILVFFTISELITANVIEPVLFGKTTGLTPIALLVAALFWAWLWGPIGLLLSTPLTVCLVVLGQHLPHLRSLKVLLAEQPVLDAKLQFFQRLLAHDAEEGQLVFERYATEFDRTRAFDEVLVPALRWTRRERLKEVITAEEAQFVWSATRESVVNSSAGEVPRERSSLPDDEVAPSSTERPRVYGYPVHHESEEIALEMLSELLADTCDVTLSDTKRLPSKVLAEMETEQPDVIVLAVLPPGGLPQVKYMCTELRSRCENSCVIVAYFGAVRDYDDLLVNVRKVGASYLTTSLAQTTHQILNLSKDDKRAATNNGRVIADASSRLKHAPSEDEFNYAE